MRPLMQVVRLDGPGQLLIYNRLTLTTAAVKNNPYKTGGFLQIRPSPGPNLCRLVDTGSLL